MHLWGGSSKFVPMVKGRYEGGKRKKLQHSSKESQRQWAP
jgi:hypothetical protein